MPTLNAPVDPAVLVGLLCRFAFKLPEQLGRAWWAALQASDHSTCRFVVRRLGRYRGTPDHFGVWFIRAVSPKTLIYATEALYEEARLARAEASLIEERVLGLMAKGDWK